MNTIKETTLHPDGNEGVDLYPKTNINQVQELPQKLTSVENQINQLNIDKLTKPVTPTAESAVTMLADGTVGTKLLSEIGGGKLYLHNIKLTCKYEGVNYQLYFKIYSSIGESFTINDLPTHTPSNTYIFVNEYDDIYTYDRNFVGVVNISTGTVEVQCVIVSDGLSPVTSFLSRVLLIERSTVTILDTYIEL